MNFGVFKKNKQLLRIGSLVFILLGTLFSFQNCSRVNFSDKSAGSSNLILSSSVPDEAIVSENIGSTNPDPNGLAADSNFLGCDSLSEAGKAAISTTFPTQLPKGPFQDSLDNIGQAWRYSNKVNLKGQLEFFSKSPNTAIRLNGEQLPLTWMGSTCNMYYRSITVSEADVLEIASVSYVWGASVVWVVVAIDGKLSIWKNSTHDYTSDGGHNATGAVQGSLVNGQPKGYKCSGNIIKVMNGSGWYSQGECVDYAQSHPEVQCGEVPGGGAGTTNECRLFDGPAVKGGADLSFSVILFESLQNFLARP